MTLRLSAGAFRFLGTTGFLKGSTPEDFAHLWHRNPGGGTAAIVYLVYRQRQRYIGGTPLKLTYHSKLLLTPYTVFKTSDRWSGGFIRVFDKSGVSILVVIVIIVIIFRLLCFGFSLCFQLCLGGFGELPLLRFRGFLWFVQLVRIVSVGRLSEQLVGKRSTTKGPTDFSVLGATAFCLCARRWSICCPSATGDCCWSYSGFLGQFR